MSEAAETREAIMEATFEALAEHGYAGLTIQTIADEFEKSKSLLYYHYDTKEDLLADFLRWMTDEFVAEVEPIAAGDTETRLAATLDLLLPYDLDDEGRAIRTALFELRMQAPHHEAYADRFAALDAQLESTLEATLQHGVEEGVYDVDPERGARLLTATANGELLHVVTGETDAAEARVVLDALVERFRA
jgi:AcrR family transcriptional regulator